MSHLLKALFNICLWVWGSTHSKRVSCLRVCLSNSVVPSFSGTGWFSLVEIPLKRLVFPLPSCTSAVNITLLNALLRFQKKYRRTRHASFLSVVIFLRVQKVVQCVSGTVSDPFWEWKLICTDEYNTAPVETASFLPVYYKLFPGPIPKRIGLVLALLHSTWFWLQH